MPAASPTRLSIADARRIALAAQGFGNAWKTKPTTAGLRRLVQRLGAVQLDFVNVVVPAHYHVVYSRVGHYPRQLLDDLVYRHRHCTEHWAHEASIVPMETYPLLRYRREKHRVWPYGFETFLSRNVPYVDSVVEFIRARGVVTAADVPDPPQGGRRLDFSWYGTVPRAVLEALFGYGRLSIAGRHAGFARAYDLPERIVPEEYLSARVEEPDARRALIEQAALAHGVATAGDLADYFRMKAADARPAVADLVSAGVLEPVEVEGWREPAYLHRNAPRPNPVEAQVLLSPFDPVIWTRKRTERLFGFDYRFEIFIPEAKRKWGAYVLPFLHRERLAARVDCKAERAESELTVRGVWLEEWADPQATISALSQALKEYAAWLGLQQIRTERNTRTSVLLRALLRSTY